jgi:hypothetical protein
VPRNHENHDLTCHFLEVPDPSAPGLLLGYGNLSDRLVDEAVAMLAGILGQAGR